MLSKRAYTNNLEHLLSFLGPTPGDSDSDSDSVGTGCCLNNLLSMSKADASYQS